MSDASSARQPLFCANEDRSRISDDPIRSLWLAVLHQALTDAWWLGDGEAGWRPGLPQARGSRAVRRLEAIAFVTGLVCPDSRDDVGFGEAGELLTLDLICGLLGWDATRVRERLLGILRPRSPVHGRLIELMLAARTMQEPSREVAAT